MPNSEQQYEWLFDLSQISAPAPLPDTPARPPASRPSPQRSPAQVLAQLPFLRGLSPAQIQKILRVSAVGTYAAGQTVCGMDAPSDEMYILLSGELGVLNREGVQALSIKPITAVGVLGFLTQSPRQVGLAVLQPGKVLRISRSRFNQLLQSDPEIQTQTQQNTIALLSERLIRLRNLVETALLQRPQLPPSS